VRCLSSTNLSNQIEEEGAEQLDSSVVGCANVFWDFGSAVRIKNKE